MPEPPPQYLCKMEMMQVFLSGATGYVGRAGAVENPPTASRILDVPAIRNISG